MGTSKDWLTRVPREYLYQIDLITNKFIMDASSPYLQSQAGASSSNASLTPMIAAVPAREEANETTSEPAEGKTRTAGKRIIELRADVLLLKKQLNWNNKEFSQRF